ncbi:MAG TPA: phosphoribosyltransferase [Longimicrobiales bacterium]
MLIYRDAQQSLRPSDEVVRLRRHAAAGDAAALLVGIGELEQAVVDALRPLADGWGAPDRALRRGTMAAAAAYLAARARRPADHHLRAAVAALDAFAAAPRRAVVHAPEGYVHYALDPAGYAAAAERYRRAVGRSHAERAVVIGIRSIGTSLSAVVATVLGSARTVTVRPRGRTGARHIRADASLVAQLAAWLADGADVLIVDEGPGATGETMAATARWLRDLGIAEARIVLFPSHTGGPSLADRGRRAWFDAARKYPPPAGDPRPARVAARLGLSAPRDLSAGEWRRLVRGGAAVPACTGHERSKHYARDDDGVAYLIRFAGLGRWGVASAARATRLAEAGLAAEPRDFSDGFLVRPWIEGSPADRRVAREADFITALDRYLCARAPLFRTGRPVETGPILDMLCTNAAEALGPRAGGLAAAARLLDRLPAREAVIPDGRLQPHEWLRTPAGYRKVDALDHGDGLRLPGPADVAWDLAGAAIEFSLDDDVIAGITRRCAAAAGDDAALLDDAVAACRAPYAAYWLADATLSAREALDDFDRARLHAEALRYRAALARELRRAAARTAARRSA